MQILSKDHKRRVYHMKHHLAETKRDVIAHKCD